MNKCLAYLFSAFALCGSILAMRVIANDATARGVTVINYTPGFTFSEVTSRGITIVNRTEAAEPTESISLAVTVANGAPPPIFLEAISRAATIVNPLSSPQLSEASSLAATVVRPLEPPPFNEAISRAVTTCNAGDLNASGVVDLGDVNLFVDVLLGSDTDPSHVTNCDLNCDDSTDGLDLQPFVSALLDN